MRKLDWDNHLVKMGSSDAMDSIWDLQKEDTEEMRLLMFKKLFHNQPFLESFMIKRPKPKPKPPTRPRSAKMILQLQKRDDLVKKKVKKEDMEEAVEAIWATLSAEEQDKYTTKAATEAAEYEVKKSCLLYTSDAADEEDSVDLGGRRIIKKKKNKK
eukprot:TRINITY_DN33426_c0_g1_i1.p1 TRINITY_DN33426_c0_g1~~TRINITY_DN33426_c0_g1_i1.p1  ORF type:complete len:157 (-),score=56.02 TRINITY_DN33426_c0_g1_i1:95-565(-)